MNENEPPDRSTADGRAAEIARIMESPRILLRVFYVGVLTIALIGQTQAAHHWLNWWLLFAAAAVLAVEVGGVAVLAYADARRQLKERALLARLVSAGIAAGSVAVNWLGHTTPGHPTLVAGFFAGMSALGYIVWLIDSEARRRDRLRITGDLAEAPPSYEWMLWLRHPVITSRARAIAKADASLGRYGSWDAAAQQLREERRNARLSAATKKHVAETAEDRRMGEIAALSVDFDTVAGKITAAVDYDRIAQIMIDKLGVGAPAAIGHGQPVAELTAGQGPVSGQRSAELTGRQPSALPPGQPVSGQTPGQPVSGQTPGQPVSRSAENPPVSRSAGQPVSGEPPGQPGQGSGVSGQPVSRSEVDDAVPVSAPPVSPSRSGSFAKDPYLAYQDSIQAVIAVAANWATVGVSTKATMDGADIGKGTALRVKYLIEAMADDQAMADFARTKLFSCYGWRLTADQCRSARTTLTGLTILDGEVAE
jgi:hypothetical protein